MAQTKSTGSGTNLNKKRTRNYGYRDKQLHKTQQQQHHNQWKQEELQRSLQYYNTSRRSSRAPFCRLLKILQYDEMRTLGK